MLTNCQQNENTVLFKPNPTDSSKFIMCNNGIAVEMQCPVGTFFDATLNICNFEKSHEISSQTVNEVGTTSLDTKTIESMDCSDFNSYGFR